MSAVWDVVIAGAGPAGAVAAYTLARIGRRTLLIDDVKPIGRKVGESLPGAARPLLRKLELLATIQDGPHLPCYGNVSAWGSNELVATDFILDPNGIGWHLDRPGFDLDLRVAAQGSGVVLHTARIERATLTDDGWHIQMTDGTTSARWLIDATGRSARVARSLGANRFRDDSLVALCAWAVLPNDDRDTRTLVESTQDGWWYTARLPDNTRVAVLHVDAENAAAILHTPRAWEAHLGRTTHMRHLMMEANFIEGPQGVEACGARLDRFAGENWLAVGDAALAFDPLSSQGIFNALYTGMKAGQAVDAALSGTLDPVEAYSERLESIRSAYLHHHELIYQSERRWIDHSFWARRQSAPDIMGQAGCN